MSKITVKYDDLLEEFKNILKRNGLKFTVQRELILDCLYNSDDHVTPENLYALIQKKHSDLNIGIATIYRTLSLLEDSHIVTSLSFGAAGKKYELGAKEHHDHMICVECGTIEEFVDDEIEHRQELIATKHNFKIKDHSMQIYGICGKCQNTLNK